MNNIEQTIKTIIQDEIRPQIQSHNGDIEFIKYADDIVYVSLKGACIGCPFSFYTLVMGVQETLQRHIPSIKSIKTLD
jgi:Fe-S cluster biogenesis protein NfuA